MLIADLMLRVTALEKLLVDKGIMTKEEITQTADEIASKVAKTVVQKINATKHIDKMVEELGGTKKGFDN